MDPFGEKLFGLIEMGSNSLKLYVVDPTARKDGETAIETHKAPWRVAHDFFEVGRVRDATMGEIVDLILAAGENARGIPLSSMLAVATGVFRELEEIDDIAARIKESTGVRVRVISGTDEARLMARDFRWEGSDQSVFLCDLGGATTEWAWFRDGAYRRWGSLPLGAIRNEYLLGAFKDDAARYLREGASTCDPVLRELPFSETARVVATGGTAKAVAACFGADEVPLEFLRDLMVRVHREGPPEVLKPARRAVFLPGLMILWRVLVRCGSPTLTYGQNSVRSGMAGRLVRLLGSHRREDLHATLLLNSRSVRPE